MDPFEIIKTRPIKRVRESGPSSLGEGTGICKTECCTNRVDNINNSNNTYCSSCRKRRARGWQLDDPRIARSQENPHATAYTRRLIAHLRKLRTAKTLRGKRRIINDYELAVKRDPEGWSQWRYDQ